MQFSFTTCKRGITYFCDILGNNDKHQTYPFYAKKYSIYHLAPNLPPAFLSTFKMSTLFCYSRLSGSLSQTF